MPPDTYIKAVVERVFPEGRHGPYVVATSDQIEGSVTFSLEPTVWKEDEWPEEGTEVLLEKLRKKRAGWRAKEGRFWKLSDEQAERGNAVEFIYPTSRQFPFDDVCERIVDALEQRNWDIPGLTVKIDDYGSGDQKLRLVRSIEGRDFKIRFGRIQRHMPGGRWNDNAAVADIVIPKKELSVYEDESGPTFYLYVGDDWGRDRVEFMGGSKVNSKLDGDPRTYLRYLGGCDCSKDGMKHTHTGQRSPVLVHDSDLGREYEPVGDEPTHIATVEVMEEIRRYLEETVLASIRSHPMSEERVDILATPDPIPFPESVGSLFCVAEYRDAKRIKQGKTREGLEDLELADRYGLSASGYRLVSLYAANDGTVPNIAYESFLWCGFGEVDADTTIDSLEISGQNRLLDHEKFVIRLKPDRANNIYIADHAPYERRRKELGDAMVDRDSFTDAEVDDFNNARARTIVPITEYQGEFEQPVVLINRDLSFGEVEVVSGPHERR